MWILLDHLYSRCPLLIGRSFVSRLSLIGIILPLIALTSGMAFFNRGGLILLGLRHLAASLPLSSLVGAAIGAGTILGSSSSGTSRNPPTSNPITRWALIGPPSVEASGPTGSAPSSSFLHAPSKAVLTSAPAPNSAMSHYGTQRLQLGASSYPHSSFS